MQKLYGLHHVVELLRVDSDCLAVACRDLHIFVLIGSARRWRLIMQVVQAKVPEDSRQQRLQERLEVLLQAGTDSLRGLLDVLSLNIVSLDLGVHHCPNGFPRIIEELFLSHRDSKQRHALERLTTKSVLLLAGGGHHKTLQHWHDAVIVLDKVLLHDACYYRDGGDGLLPNAAMLRVLQLHDQLLHQRPCIPVHQRVVQLLAE
mmetsp:Transcript_72745/g.173664  ORF Transcript_72745/g.173664 Transcript_72745/m.173664 type:complete len:204 (-) Transcript_72745:1514-2125(-)